MKTQILIILSFFIFNFVSVAQITFEKTYGTIYYDEAKSIRQTVDGGYIIGGTNLVKIDSLGIEEWTQPYFSFFANPTFAFAA